MIIRTATLKDAPAICAIYNYYIAQTTITFEIESVTSDDIERRISHILQSNYPYLVAEDNHGISGYAYACQWKSRSAYQHSVEISVYLDSSATGQGVGYQLYQALFQQLKDLGYHLAIAGICLPNPVSVKLHEKMGMSKVGEFYQVGYKFGQWIDVGYWQKVL